MVAEIVNPKKVVLKSDVVDGPNARKVVINFPYLFEKKEFEGKERYSAIFNLGAVDGPNASQIRALKAAAAVAAKEKWGDKIPKDIVTPFKMGSHMNKNGPKEGFLDTDFYINAATDNQPNVVGRDPYTSLTDKRQCYAGCVVNASVNAYAWEYKGKTGAVMKRGVSFNLQNVQVVRQEKPIGGMAARPQDDFESLMEDVATGVDAGEAVFGAAEEEELDEALPF